MGALQRIELGTGRIDKRIQKIERESYYRDDDGSLDLHDSLSQRLVRERADIVESTIATENHAIDNATADNMTKIIVRETHESSTDRFRLS